jgi:hypothetical protein
VRDEGQEARQKEWMGERTEGKKRQWLMVTREQRAPRREQGRQRWHEAKEHGKKNKHTEK